VCDDFDLCVDCFSVGAELKPHKSDHSYRVMDNLDYKVLTDDWAADEELLLLEGIDLYGLGNWADVAIHVGTKSKQKCEQHFFDVYINGDWSDAQSIARSATTHASSAVAEEGATEAPPKHEKSQDGRSMKRPKAAEVDPKQSTSNAIEYNARRGDFDIEYENDAETILADLAFDEEDSKEDTDLKVRIVELYNRKLDERASRKKFILDRNLLDFKKQQGFERRRLREEREIYALMRPFARFHSAAEHEELVKGLIQERKHRKTIEVYQHWREMGLRTIAEGQMYDLKKRKRDDQEKLRKSTQNAHYLNSSARPGQRGTRYTNRDEADAGALVVKAADQRGLPGGPEKKMKKAQLPLDLTSMPGLELLSIKERELCAAIRLPPQQYLWVKHTLLYESLRLGSLNRQEARRLVKIGALCF
jgi:transcriptional adapter 2-alpha